MADDEVRCPHGYIIDEPRECPGTCEMDGVTEHWDDGHEMYWHCEMQATEELLDMALCRKHAIEVASKKLAEATSPADIRTWEAELSRLQDQREDDDT